MALGILRVDPVLMTVTSAGLSLSNTFPCLKGVFDRALGCFAWELIDIFVSFVTLAFVNAFTPVMVYCEKIASL